MKRRNILNKNKKGAASFYVVAFSTLILVIVAASFATIIISEITRTSNDDLAQSAYDSALAGVEDAKLAYATYQGCIQDEIKPSDSMSCPEVVEIVKLGNLEDSGMETEGYNKCDMVSNILGRPKNEDGSVTISEVKKEDGNDNGMLQAYTCVMIKTELGDYRSSVSSGNPVKLVPVRPTASADGIDSASSIKSVVISWYSDTDRGVIPKFGNYKDGNVIFPAATVGVSAPPTIGVTLIQTSATFDIDSFTTTRGNETNRGTVYLVPTDVKRNEWPQNGASESFYASEGETNTIPATGFLYSNDKTATNQNRPYLVYCDPDKSSSFLCSANIELPNPIGGSRISDTFYFAISLPYGRPATSFSMKFCSSDNNCFVKNETTNEMTFNESSKVMLSGSQIAVDSTGKANDLFRRVEVRLEPTNTSFPYPLYGIQLLDTQKEGSNILKNLNTICEWSFPTTGSITGCRDW